MSHFQNYVTATKKHRAEEAAATLEALKVGSDPPTTWGTEVTTWLKAQLSGVSTHLNSLTNPVEWRSRLTVALSWRRTTTEMRRMRRILNQRQVYVPC